VNEFAPNALALFKDACTVISRNVLFITHDVVEVLAVLRGHGSRLACTETELGSAHEVLAHSGQKVISPVPKSDVLDQVELSIVPRYTT
jgi:hypothetical protein